MASPLVLLGMIVLLSILIAVSYALHSASTSGKIDPAPTEQTKAPGQYDEAYGSPAEQTPVEEDNEAAEDGESQNQPQDNTVGNVMDSDSSDRPPEEPVGTDPESTTATNR